MRKIVSPRTHPVLYNGYYLYNNVGYTNREYAVDEILSNLPHRKDEEKKIITFYFHDEVFEKINWLKEPVETIDQLYLKRAIQLRDKYKYLILSYSGGSDSQQILDTFLNNNIFLDEIQTVNWNKAIAKLDRSVVEQDDDINYLLEYDINVVPNLARVKSLSPNTKITVLDTSDFLFDDVKSGRFEMIGMNNLGAWRSLLVPVPRSWTLTQNYHMNKIIHQDGVAMIQGIDKPHFYLSEGKCYFRFSDAGYYSEKFINNKLIDDVYRTEYFFWTPDLPEIVVKQAHMLRNKLNKDKSYYELLNKIHGKFMEHKESRHIKALLFEDLEDYMVSVIYPNSRTIKEIGKPLKIGPEYMVLSKYHDMGIKIASAMKEALTFRVRKYAPMDQQLKTSLIFSQGYCVGDFNPSWIES